jgi:hypothetical protein
VGLVTTDWVQWHEPYADPASPLSRRRAVVQGVVGRWLDNRQGGAGRVLSMCAGDGRDVLEVLAGRPEDASLLDVVLVERDPRLASVAKALALDAGLDRVEVRVADAGTTDSYVDATPADLVLACGIFGNVSNDDVHRTVAMLPGLCAEEALVVWTRGRDGTDPTPQVRRWFAEHEFAEREWHAPEDAGYSVGVHQLVGAPTPLEPGRRLFTFLR